MGASVNWEIIFQEVSAGFRWFLGFQEPEAHTTRHYSDQQNVSPIVLQYTVYRRLVPKSDAVHRFWVGLA